MIVLLGFTLLKILQTNLLQSIFHSVKYGSMIHTEPCSSFGTRVHFLHFAIDLSGFESLGDAGGFVGELIHLI